MEKLIACCGLNCATCDARIATVKNDDELRKVTAEKWKQMYGASDLTPEMINWHRMQRAWSKIPAIAMNAKSRNCVKAKGYDTCGECKELETCHLFVAGVHKYVPGCLNEFKKFELKENPVI